MDATQPTQHQLAPDATLAALHHGAVLQWWQTTAFLEVAGPDAATLLDGLCTQAVLQVEPTHALLALFLDAKARIIAPAVLHRVEDSDWTDARTDAVTTDAPRLLLETLPDLVEPLRAHLQRYRLRARVSIEPTECASAALVGAGASADAEHAAFAPLQRTLRADTHAPTVTFIGSGEQIAAAVAAASQDGDIGLADPDALEGARIHAGIAGLHDLLPGRMPAEVGGMQHAVSLDAGCYLGQEPVARLHYRGRANRTLRLLTTQDPLQVGTATDADEPDAPFELRRVSDAAAARAVGRITTWARAASGETLALAILRREIPAGTSLSLHGAGVTLTVIDDAPTPAREK